jgi:gliding motility-associated-like protein
MKNNPIEELRHMETPVTEEEWASIVNDRRYVRKFGRKGGLSPKGRAAIVAGAVAALITIPILVKTLSHNETEAPQKAVPAAQTATEQTASGTTEPAHTRTTVATTEATAKTERETHTAVTTARSSSSPSVISNSQHTESQTIINTPSAVNPPASNVKVTSEKAAPGSVTATADPVPTPANPPTAKPQQNTASPVTHEEGNHEIVLRSAEEEPVPEADQFFIPSAFTPNGDGLNDLFLVKANFIPSSFELTILNRGGDALFQTRDINIGWDGHLHGKVLPQGVYVCIIKYKDNEGKEHKQQGQVLLLP